jgi:hypothetical protein
VQPHGQLPEHEIDLGSIILLAVALLLPKRGDLGADLLNRERIQDTTSEQAAPQIDRIGWPGRLGLCLVQLLAQLLDLGLGLLRSNSADASACLARRSASSRAAFSAASDFVLLVPFLRVLQLRGRTSQSSG